MGYDEEVDPSNWESEDDDVRFASRNVERNESADETDPVKILNDYLPKSWDGRTRLSRNQPAAIAMLRQFSKMFPNIIGDGAYEAICLHMLDDYEELQTSVRGKSRGEFEEILKHMNTNKNEQEVSMSHADVPDPEDSS